MAATLSQLAKIRETISLTEAELRAVDQASLPKEDAEDRVTALVHSLASRFDADYLGRAICAGKGTVQPVDLIVAAEVETDPAERMLIIAAWLQPDNLKAKLMASAAPYVVTGKTALPIADRPAIARKLDQRLHELAVEEEALLRELEAAGHDVWRRPGVDPLVVLGV